jgi:hypothetical protein
VHSLRALLEIGVDMTRFEVHTETPERWQRHKTWTPLIKDIQNENKVFKFFWSERDVAQRLWKKKEKKTLKEQMEELEKIYGRIQEMREKVKTWTLLIKEIKNKPLQKEKKKETLSKMMIKEIERIIEDMESELKQRLLKETQKDTLKMEEKVPVPKFTGDQHKTVPKEEDVLAAVRAKKSAHPDCDLTSLRKNIKLDGWELQELPVFTRVKMLLSEKKNLENKKIEFESKMDMTKSFGFDPAHLKTVYRSLLGGKMNYQMGDLGPHLDIFFVCVLMNHRELAFELWKQCEVPVCAAICAVRLLLYLPQQRART